MEKDFDKLFGYNRQLYETFEYCNTIKNGSMTDKIRIQEQELKGLRSEVAALERKIQLTLAPPQQSEKESSEQKQETKAVSPVGSNAEQFIKDNIIIARPKPHTSEASKGFKM